MYFNCIETKKNIPRNAELILDESTSIIYAEINPIETCLFKPDINPPKLFKAKETLSTHSFTNASETSIETIEAAEQQENTLFKQEIVSKCVQNPCNFSSAADKVYIEYRPELCTIKEEPIETPDFYLFDVQSERIKSDSDNNLYEIVSLNPPDQSYTELTNQQTPNDTVNSNNESNTQNENSNTQETSVPSLDDHDAFIKWIEEYNFNKSPDPSKITEI
ncbi:hypothetical protein CWI36_1440p0020 [Hamiltosporidium magnivora]|uniref:Uncharacterized protein n=1 Tax=Hamiltosporidium magnivora TaxID=148818 RepID=A0A4Q9L164_9MICR|nr:hypothetical protein CWI36_1440p0020 [Hamiltosporidium magnivora]